VSAAPDPASAGATGATQAVSRNSAKNPQSKRCAVNFDLCIFSSSFENGVFEGWFRQAQPTWVEPVETNQRTSLNLQ
jgi:hypothetical protein